MKYYINYTIPQLDLSKLNKPINLPPPVEITHNNQNVNQTDIATHVQYSPRPSNIPFNNSTEDRLARHEMMNNPTPLGQYSPRPSNVPTDNQQTQNPLANPVGTISQALKDMMDAIKNPLTNQNSVNDGSEIKQQKIEQIQDIKSNPIISYKESNMKEIRNNWAEMINNPTQPK